jgi:polyisoprenoid-binding protein YceI
MFFDFTADSKNMGDIGFSSTTMSSFDFNKFDEEVKYDQKQIQKLKFKLTLVLDSI